VDDTNRTNNSAGAIVYIIPDTARCEYDLELTKSVDNDTVYQGGDVEFRIVVRNNGPCAAAGILVTDILPDSLTFSNSEPQPLDPFAADTLRWEIPPLDSGATFTIVYTAKCPGEVAGEIQLVNSACLVAQFDTDASNNCDAVSFVCKPLTDCMADRSSFYLDRNIFQPGKAAPPLAQDLVITLNLKNNNPITLDIFDITGYPIKRIAEGMQMHGENSYTWDGRTESGEFAGSGVYLVFVRDQTTGGRQLECYLKVILVQ
jgi:uncharacterized repeat protein (TIGR01451 family)